jgi:DNA-binding LytR/AlgR family response regulator
MKKEKYNCVVIDDEFLARKLMAEYISKVPQLELTNSFDSPVEAIDFIAQGSTDIIFTDIEMSEISGIDFIKNLAPQFRPIVIFVTAYPQYAVQGFEVDAIEYLLKPVTFSRFFKAVSKAINILNIRQKADMADKPQPVAEVQPVSSSKDYIIVKTDRKIVKLMFDDIYFIEGAMEYVTFYTLEQKVMGLFSLKKLEEDLPGERFLRIHKSYIVALDKIREIDGNQVRVGNWTITVSKSMRPELVKLFSGNQPS